MSKTPWAAVEASVAKKPVVLVVDDNAGIRELLHLMLDDDYEVADAADGSEGVNIASVFSRPAKQHAAENADAATVSVLPMELRIGDRFTDQDFEREVVTRREVLHGAKILRARIQRPGFPRANGTSLGRRM